MKTRTVLLTLVFAANVIAQEAEPVPPVHKSFEGELHYRSMENYDKRMEQMMPNSLYYNGARDVTFIIKGEKVLMIDESMQYKVLLDPENDVIVYFSEHINKGVTNSYAKHSNMQGLFQKKGNYNAYLKTFNPPEVYHFEPTGKSLPFEDREVPLYQGRIETVMGVLIDQPMLMISSFDFAEDFTFRMPQAYFFSFCYGLEREGLLTKYVWEMIVDINLLGGKFNSYACSELKKVVLRSVSDEEFIVPDNIKLQNERLQGTTLNTFWTEHCRYMKKHKIHPKQLNKDVVYEINEEWDF